MQWCGPCKMIKPLFEQMSTEYESIYFLQVDVDDVPVSSRRQGRTCITGCITRVRSAQYPVSGGGETNRPVQTFLCKLWGPSSLTGRGYSLHCYPPFGRTPTWKLRLARLPAARTVASVYPPTAVFTGLSGTPSSPAFVLVRHTMHAIAYTRSNAQRSVPCPPHRLLPRRAASPQCPPSTCTRTV